MVEVDTQTLVVLGLALIGYAAQWGTNKKTVSTLEKKIESLEAFDTVTNSEYHELNTQIAVLTRDVSALSDSVRELTAEVRELRKK